MKKLITTFLVAALLLTAIPLSLTSCSQSAKLLRMDEEERAAYFYELINENADHAASGSMEQTMSMKLDIGTMTYEQVSDATITYIAEDDDLTYLEQVKTTVLTDGDKMVLYEDNGYADGMMFSYRKDGKDETKLKSPITAEEFDAFMVELNADSAEIRVGEDFSEVMTCVQNQDKTWTATFEDFTDEGMIPFWEMLDGIEYTVTAEHKLVDVRLTCHADKDFYPTEFIIEYIFRETKGASTRVPEIRMHTEYSGWNNTLLSEPYDTADFTEVEDIRMIRRFTEALRNRETAKEGHFKVTNTSDFHYIGGENTRVEMITDVTYKNRNGMTMDMIYEEEGYRYEMNCEDGAMHVVVYDTETGTKVTDEYQVMTDADVQSMLSRFMDSESIAEVDMVDARVLSEKTGDYRFTLGDAVKNPLKDLYESEFGGTMDDFEGYIDATMVDGQLMAYTYHVFVSLKIGMLTLYVNVDMTVEFLDIVEGGEIV